jgi:endonuclease III
MDENLEKTIATWTPTHMDFTFGEILMSTEDYSKVAKRYYAQGDDFYSGMLFSALLYSILSWKEKFKQHKKQFNEFLEENLWTAKKVVENPGVVERILKSYGFNEKKIETVTSAARAWEGLDKNGEPKKGPESVIWTGRKLQDRIREDENMELGFQLRKEIAKEMHGVGYKFASLFLRMCGYHDIVPIDSTAIKYIERRGLVDRRANSGLDRRQYLIYEKFIIDEAKKYRKTPALFQATIYARWSTWRKDSGILGVY